MIETLRRWLRWRLTQIAHRRHGIDWVGFWLIMAIAILLFLIGALAIYRHAELLGQLD